MTRQQQQELHNSFIRNGYVKLEGFVAPDEIKEVHRNLERFINDSVPSLPRDEVYYEDINDSSTIKQIPRLNKHDDYFDRHFTRGRFPELAEILLGCPVAPWSMQFFNKPPGIGQPTPAHQDGYYFMLTPCEALTMWLALEEVDEQNGCVRYVTGSNRKGMRPHGKTDTLGFSQGVTDFGPKDSANEMTFSAMPGDLLVHHALTVHRADGNRTSDRSRRALGFVYFAAHAREDTAMQKEYQRQLTQDRIDAGKI